VPPYATLLGTYLVTDIEGSKQLPRTTVAETQSFVEQALSARGGRVVSAEADGVVAWFATVAEAVRAAAAARDGSAVKIRIGIAPRRRVAERVSDSGHGGQILLSWSARRALRRALRRVGFGLYQLDPDTSFPPPRRSWLRRLA
jgi:class 3 adenylate cyclase